MINYYQVYWHHEKIVRDSEENLHVSITEDFRYFVCNFYTEAVVGMLINLFQHPDICECAKTYEYFSVILHNSLPAVLLSQGNPSLN